MVEWVDLLTTGMEGCVTPEELEELVAMFCLMDDIPCSWNAGVTWLPLCKAGCSVSGSIVWKFLDTLEGIKLLVVPLLALGFQLEMRR